MEQEFVIKRSCMNKQVCPCGRTERPDTPFWVFIEGDSQGLCFECCKKHEPEMLSMCQSQNNAFWRAYGLLTDKETGEPETAKYQDDETPFKGMTNETDN